MTKLKKDFQDCPPLQPKPVDEKTHKMSKVLLEAIGVKVMPLKGR